MSKKVKVLISALVVAVLLTMGGITMVMAEGEAETTPPPEATAKGLLQRVADILEIDTEDLISAFKQAQQEMGDEALINRLNQAVADGRITREQAGEIIKWWEQRPDDTIREWWGQKPEVIEPGMFKHNLTFRFRAMPMPGEVINPGMFEHNLRFRSSFRNYQQNGTRWGFCPRLPGETD